jgi:osmotically-inducible protein OsmY
MSSVRTFAIGEGLGLARRDVRHAALRSAVDVSHQAGSCSQMLRWQVRPAKLTATYRRDACTSTQAPRRIDSAITAEGVIMTRSTASQTNDSELRQALQLAISRAIQLNAVGDSAGQAAQAPTHQVGHHTQRIAASVRDGRVTLSGTVRSWADGEAVIKAARSVPGVRSIDNRLRINPNI